MNYNTLAIMTQTKAPEPLLEHEIRLHAYDFYEQRGRAAGHSPRDHYVALPDNSLREPDAVTLNGRGCIRVRVEPEPLSFAGEIDSVNSRITGTFYEGSGCSYCVAFTRRKFISDLSACSDNFCQFGTLCA